MTDTAVALRPSGQLSIRDDQDFWTPEQAAALQVLGIKGATNGDLAVFFHYCRRTQLDPFSRQIYMINRRTKERWQDDRGQWQEQWVTKQTIQVGIDGFRVVRDRVADRTGYVCWFEDTAWYDADGHAHSVWISDKPPAACRVVLVKRERQGIPGFPPVELRFPAVLRTASYMQTNSKGEPVSQWKTQPEHMIEKCCEAFATRRAFPNDFAGVYLEDEMAGRDSADRDQPAAEHRPVTAAEIIRDAPPATQPERQPRRASQAALKILNDHLASLDLGPNDDVHDLFAWVLGAPYDATSKQVSDVTKWLESHLEACGGDFAKAAGAIWDQYNAQHPGEASDG